MGYLLNLEADVKTKESISKRVVKPSQREKRTRNLSNFFNGIKWGSLKNMPFNLVN